MRRSETCSSLPVLSEGQTGNMTHNEPLPSRAQLCDIRNISNGPSRFNTAKTGTKGKTVRLPGKKGVAKKIVFEQRGNMRDETDKTGNPKKLKTRDYRVAERTEMKVTEKAASPKPVVRVTGSNRLLKGQEKRNSKIVTMDQGISEEGVPKPSTSGKHRKPRHPMPTIPIPVPLPEHLVAERRQAKNEMDQLSTVIGCFRQTFPRNAHSLGLKDKWFGNNEAIFRHLRAEDEFYVINPAFCCMNSDVKPDTRRILIDWMTQVQTYFDLTDATLHLTVRMADQFISRRKVKLASYQLVGVTCFLLAAKFEERFPPSLEKLVHLTDDSYTEDDVVRMERTILCELEFKIHFPLATEYLDYFLCVVPITYALEKNAARVRNLCRYLLDLTLPSIHMVQWPTYMVTAATVCLATKMVAQYCASEYTENGNDDEYDEMMSTNSASKFDIATKSLDQYCESGYAGNANDDTGCDEAMSNMSIVAADQDTRCAVCQSLDVQCLSDSVLLHYTGTREERLLPAMQRIATILSRVKESPHQAATQKYRSHSKYGNISEWSGLKTPVVDDITAFHLYQ